MCVFSAQRISWNYTNDTNAPSEGIRGIFNAPTASTIDDHISNILTPSKNEEKKMGQRIPSSDQMNMTNIIFKINYTLLHSFTEIILYITDSMYTHNSTIQNIIQLQTLNSSHYLM